MPLHTFEAIAGTVRITWALPAPSADAWAHLTNLAHLPEWLGRPTSGRFKEGATLVVDHGDGACSTSRVATSTAGLLRMTWEFPDEPESALTVRLEDSGQGCILTLTHSGLGALTRSTSRAGSRT